MSVMSKTFYPYTFMWEIVTGIKQQTWFVNLITLVLTKPFVRGKRPPTAVKEHRSFECQLPQNGMYIIGMSSSITLTLTGSLGVFQNMSNPHNFVMNEFFMENSDTYLVSTNQLTATYLNNGEEAFIENVGAYYDIQSNIPYSLSLSINISVVPGTDNNALPTDLVHSMPIYIYYHTGFLDSPSPGPVHINVTGDYPVGSGAHDILDPSDGYEVLEDPGGLVNPMTMKLVQTTASTENKATCIVGRGELTDDLSNSVAILLTNLQGGMPVPGTYSYDFVFDFA